MESFSPNSTFLYLVAGVVIVYVLAQSAFFLYKALRQGHALGIARSTLRKTFWSSALFSIMPAVSFLIGVISLSAFLGLPLPWIRLSVIGAITYELPAAESTARALQVPTTTLVADAGNFATIAWVMTLGILSGLLVILFGLRRIQSGLLNIKSKDERWGEIFVSALFMGMIAAFVGMLFADIRQGLSGWVPVAVALASALLMAVCGLLIKKLKWTWLEQYALPLCMLGGMALSLPLTAWMK